MSLEQRLQENTEAIKALTMTISDMLSAQATHGPEPEINVTDELAKLNEEVLADAGATPEPKASEPKNKNLAAKKTATKKPAPKKPEAKKRVHEVEDPIDADEEVKSERLDRIRTRVKLVRNGMGTEAAKDLLEEFGVSKVSQLTEKQYTFIEKRLDQILQPGKSVQSAEEQDETSSTAEETKTSVAGAEGVEESQKENVTYEQVRELLVKIINHNDQGKEIARGIVEDQGVKKMTELTEGDYAEVYRVARAQLIEFGVEVD
jgi:hypothetical protein